MVDSSPAAVAASLARIENEARRAEKQWRHDTASDFRHAAALLDRVATERDEARVAGVAEGIAKAAAIARQRQFTHLCSSCGLNDGEYEERSIEARTARRIAEAILAAAPEARQP